MKNLIRCLLATSLFLVTGCDFTHPKPAPVAQKETTQPDLEKLFTDVPLDDPDKNLPLSDLSLARVNGMRALAGDLRPYWVVSGRIHNDTALPVKDIHLHITIRTKGSEEEIDSAELILKNEIPADDTVSFMQNIQLLPTQGAWEWDCTVAGATTQYFK
jgi:hypothetical protein